MKQQGSGRERTIEFEDVSGEHRLVATLDGYKTVDVELKPESGISRPLAINLESIEIKRLASSVAKESPSSNNEPKFPQGSLPLRLGTGKKTFLFANEKEIERDWSLKGHWQIEGDGLRIYGGRGSKEPGEPGGVTLMSSNAAYQGDLSFEMDYELTRNCWVIIHAWNQQFEFKATGKKIGRLVRKGDEVSVSCGNEDGSPLVVKLRDDNVQSSTPISIHLDRRNLARSHMELLIHRIGNVLYGSHVHRPEATVNFWIRPIS